MPRNGIAASINSTACLALCALRAGLMNPIAMPMWPGTEQFLGLSRRFPVLTLGSKIDETSGAFMDTAALMQTLDLIVTSDTAIAHLAGALGRSVWMAVSFTPDWRWLRD